MAEKLIRTEFGLYRARKTFLVGGNIWVREGDTIVEGHPILRRHPDAFDPFEPTFGPKPQPAASPAPAPEARAATQETVAASADPEGAIRSAA
jgi:pyruvate/2-oxoglutarate dehydrogenase complex dihydrolipoamide acyltransferase (E2) component